MLRYTPVVSPHETEGLHPTRDSSSKNSSTIEELIIDSIWFMGNSTKILELTRNQHPLLNGLKLATFNSDWTSVLDTEEDGDWRRVGRSDTTNRWGETAFGCGQKAKNHLCKWLWGTQVLSFWGVKVSKFPSTSRTDLESFLRSYLSHM